MGGEQGDAGDGSGGSVSGRDARLARVADRAVAAGLEAWWTQFRNPATGQGEGPYGMRIFLPSGQRFRGVSLNGGDEADVLLKFPFERWTALQGYEAILDPDEQRIVAEITLLGTSLSRIPGAVVGPPEKDEPIGDRAAGLRLTFKLGPAPGPSSLTLAGDAGGLALELRSRAPAEIRALHGLSSSGGATLIIRGVSTGGHDEARALLEDLSAAVFIELDRSYGLAGTLHRSAVDELVKSEYDQETISSSPPRLPAARYGRDAASLYLYARSVRSQAPLLECLAYYQVIEYYMGAFSQAATIERVSTMLKDSRFDHDDELAVGRLIDAVLPGGRGKARERDQVLATVEACLNDATITQYLQERPAAAKALRNSARPANRPTGNKALRRSPASCACRDGRIPRQSRQTRTLGSPAERLRADRCPTVPSAARGRWACSSTSTCRRTSCRTAHATAYTAAIDLRRLIGELTVRPYPANGRY